MSSGNSESYDHAPKTEADVGHSAQLERLQTAGGHTDDRTQPSLPVVHHCFANPAPLGLLSFATGKVLSGFHTTNVLLTSWAGIFLISIYGIKVRGVATPNVLIGVLIFFGGVCQFIAGIMEFVSGNTVSVLFYLIDPFLSANIVSSSEQPYSHHMVLLICPTQ